MPDRIHDIIELLELYPHLFEGNEFRDYLSSNPNITCNYVLASSQITKTWNLSIFQNPSITTPHTITKLQQMTGHIHPLFLLSNSAFDEKKVSVILTKSPSSFETEFTTYYYLGKNKSITPQFHYIENTWQSYWHSFASNENFMLLIYDYLCLQKNKINITEREAIPLIHNTSFTVEMFVNLFGNKNEELQRQYMATNPNASITELEKYYKSHQPDCCYFSNINANPYQLDSCRGYYGIRSISNNPRIGIEDLVMRLNDKDPDVQHTIHCDYSKNSNLTWEDVVEYSWFAWYWKNIAKNAFKSSPLYRHATLLNELFELNIAYDYPSLVKTM